jgi:hypothetical protein
MDSGTVTCPACGSEVPVSALLCPKCGRPNISTAFAETSPATGPLFGEPPADRESNGEGKPRGTVPAAPVAPPEPAPPSPESAQVAASQGARGVQEVGATPAGSYSTPPPPSSTVDLGQWQYSAVTVPEVDPEQLFAPAPYPRQPIKLPAGEQPVIMRQPPQPSYRTQEQLRADLQSVLRQVEAQKAARPPAASHKPFEWTPYRQRRQEPPAGVAAGRARTSFLLELLGYVGLLGLGHIYAGNRARGMALLLGWWLCTMVSLFWTTFVVNMPFSCGNCYFLLYPFVPILSGLWIRSELQIKANGEGGDNLK